MANINNPYNPYKAGTAPARTARPVQRPVYSAPAGGTGLAGVGNIDWEPPAEFDRFATGLMGATQEGFRQAGFDAAAAGGAGGASRSALMNALGNTQSQRVYDQALSDYQTRDLAAQGLRLQDMSAAEQARQFGAQFGEGQYQFDNEFGLQQELGRGNLQLGRDQLALQDRLGTGDLALRAELGRGALDLDRAQLGEMMRQFDLGFGLDQQRFGELIRQFGLTFGEGQRQFDVNSQLDRDRLNELMRQADRGFELDERRLQQAADMFAEGNVQTLLNNLVGGFFGMDINPADYMEVLSAISRGDYSVLENMPAFAAGGVSGGSGGTGTGSGGAGTGSGAGGASTGSGGAGSPSPSTIAAMRETEARLRDRSTNPSEYMPYRPGGLWRWDDNAGMWKFRQDPNYTGPY